MLCLKFISEESQKIHIGYGIDAKIELSAILTNINLYMLTW